MKAIPNLKDVEYHCVDEIFGVSKCQYNAQDGCNMIEQAQDDEDGDLCKQNMSYTCPEFRTPWIELRERFSVGNGGDSPFSYTREFQQDKDEYGEHL
tara:strand:- start:228 stop:518 length:291 start_codon:yes stop_codon:yes gene_type:complete